MSALALQPDGRVLLSGEFNVIDGVARNRVARLTADGALDSRFDPGSGADGAVRALAVRADGRVVLGGDFTTVHGVARNRVARLASNGALDMGFDPGGGANGTVRALVAQADGSVLVGGDFSTVAGVARNGVAQLFANGALDFGFDPGDGANAGVFALAVHADGRVLVGGQFTTFDGVARSRIARLDADGALDSSFDPGTGANDTVLALAMQWTVEFCWSGTSLPSTARSESSSRGSPPTDHSMPSCRRSRVRTIPCTRLPSCLIVALLVGGFFSSVDGVARKRIVRLFPNGSVDPSFDIGTGLNDAVRTIVVLADGRLLIGGEFTTINGTVRNRTARLNANGSLDTTFDPGSGVNDSVFSIAVQSDGRIVLGGFFDTINNFGRQYIARLHADGSLDTSFEPGGGPNSPVNTVIVQPDGRLLIGGGFTAVGGVKRNGVARLNADGSLDASFDSAGGADGLVSAIVLQPDGRVLLGGGFATVNFVARSRVARLNAEGSLDTGFDPGIGVGSDGVFNNVLTLALQA